MQKDFFWHAACEKERIPKLLMRRRPMTQSEQSPDPLADASAEAVKHDWRRVGTQGLIAHILVRFHQRHREQLPEMIRLARRVEVAHGEQLSCPRGLADLLLALQQGLESHMMKEEQVLFPNLASADPAVLAAPIAVMRFEHEQHLAALAQIDALTGSLTLPAAACNSWRSLYGALATFRRDLREHLQLEETVLFAGTADVVAAA
ncbi:MAG: hemerythrin domain-containing protein [Pseudomonadota bacterium]|nr:hemerythrin domain-containing protein [Pseudomonadota bacterium]